MLNEDDINLPETLEEARVGSVPSSIFYIPNFISASEEEVLLNKIQNAPVTRWTYLSHRRLQSYPSKLTADNTLLSAPLPAWLMHPVVTRLQSLSYARSAGEQAMEELFSASPHSAPNHVLVNEYRPGQGIMAHEDGAAYFPIVATVSLGAPIVLDIYGKNQAGTRDPWPRYRILQEAGSLLVTVESMYTDHLHGVAEVMVDERLGPREISNWDQLGRPEDFMSGQYERQTRTSLTYRHVLKTSNIGSKLKLFGSR